VDVHSRSGQSLHPCLVNTLCRSHAGNIVLLVSPNFSGAVQLRSSRGTLTFLPAFANKMRMLKHADDEALLHLFNLLAERATPGRPGPAGGSGLVFFMIVKDCCCSTKTILHNPDLPGPGSLGTPSAGGHRRHASPAARFRDRRSHSAATPRDEDGQIRQRCDRCRFAATGGQLLGIHAAR